ncbi:hypothetical protein SSCG_01072 [Streptomyces clavuligerus]|nr:hypothetical protein SSCG_01072 [Streptomyces clavuligerus]
MRNRKVSALGAVMMLSLWAVSVGIIALAIARELETLRLPT